MKICTEMIFHFRSQFTCWVLLPPLLTVSSSASWRLVRPSLSCVSGRESTMWPTVCHWPTVTEFRCCKAPGLVQVSMTWEAVQQCPWMAWQVKARLLDGRSHARCLLTTEANIQSLPTVLLCRWALLLWEVSRYSGWFMTSACSSGHSRWFSTVSFPLWPWPAQDGLWHQRVAVATPDDSLQCHSLWTWPLTF